jgi:uncharacterized protein with HEPN domain
MQPETKDAAYLWDMLDAARAIVGFVLSSSYQEYQKNRMLRGAVERHLEIIGEAAGRVSPAFRSAHPESPWSRIVGQRNILIHEYGEIDDRLVWEVTRTHIPELVAKLEPFVPPVPYE